MDRWQGYLPLAEARLRPAVSRAAGNRTSFSSAERALYTACDFWTAVSTHSLAPHLSLGPLDALRYASILFAAIGADGVVRDVTAAIDELQRASYPHQQVQCLAKLQERLLKTLEPVDQLIARLAETLSLGHVSASTLLLESETVVRSGQIVVGAQRQGR